MFCLTAYDNTNLGGPMGSDDHQDIILNKYYNDIDHAKEAALKHYNKRCKGKKIPWTRSGKGFKSGDLLWVEYHITEVKAED